MKTSRAAVLSCVSGRRCLPSLAILLWSANASAQTAVLRLTLEDAQQRATAASHRLAEARAREGAAAGLVEVRAAADRPVVSLSGGQTRTNHVTEFAFPGPGGVPRVVYPDVP